MPIKVKCGGCQMTISAPDNRAGTKAKCPSCGAPIEIPAKADDGFDDLVVASAGASDYRESSPGRRGQTPSQRRTINSCPYCKSRLAKVPTRKVACTECGRLIRPMQGYLYTEADHELVGQRMAEAPSWEQLAFMVNLGIIIPQGCTSEQASRLIDKAKPADQPTPAQREAYIRIKNEIADRMRDCRELVDDIIENPPSRPRIQEPTAAGCSTVLLVVLAVVYLSIS